MTGVGDSRTHLNLTDNSTSETILEFEHICTYVKLIIWSSLMLSDEMCSLGATQPCAALTVHVLPIDDSSCRLLMRKGE